MQKLLDANSNQQCQRKGLKKSEQLRSQVRGPVMISSSSSLFLGAMTTSTEALLLSRPNEHKVKMDLGYFKVSVEEGSTEGE